MYKLVGRSSSVLGLMLVLNMLVLYALLIPGILMYLADITSASSVLSDEETVNPFPIIIIFFAVPSTITTFLYLRSKGVIAGCLGISVAWLFPTFGFLLDGFSWAFVLLSILPACMTIQIPFWKVEKFEPDTHVNPLPTKVSDY